MEDIGVNTTNIEMRVAKLEHMHELMAKQSTITAALSGHIPTELHAGKIRRMAMESARASSSRGA